MVIDSDIRNAVAQVKIANDALAQDDTEPNREEVCIQTRAAYAIFDEVMCWAGVVDDSASRAMRSAFEESVRLLEGDGELSGENLRFLSSTKERLDKLQEYELPASALNT